jgi:NAD(P)-dependent dehydrogenase (short-subunit alcohol dehydrogenase family)
MAGRLDGKVAVVTGGGAGIGRAASLALAREGARVLVTDVNGDAAEATAQLIVQAGGQARAAQVEVSRAAEEDAMLAGALAVFGQLDLAFNNAGINEEHGPLTETTEAEWDRILAVNLKGIWLCMKYEIPAMLAAGGAIVNTASRHI